MGGQFAVQVVGVGPDIEGPHPLAAIDDLAEDLDPALVGESARVRRLRLGGGCGVRLLRVGCQHLAVGVVQAGEFHRRLGLERMEELFGRGNVAETQHAGAVERQHSSLGLKGLHLEVTHRVDLVQADPGGRHRQRHPDRHHRQQNQFRLDRPIANGTHLSTPYGILGARARHVPLERRRAAGRAAPSRMLPAAKRPPVSPG